jgi:hypothetical protein
VFLTAQYETLRARVVGDPVVGRPAHGFAVVLRSGLAAWLAQMQPAHAERERDEQPAMWREDGPPVRSSAGDALTATTILILASMVLAAQVE